MTDEPRRTTGYPADRLASGFRPERQAGLERLHAFARFAGVDYARLRNFDFGTGDRSNVSMLSPWLRHRAILEEEVIHAVLDQHPITQAGAFIQEVLWRGYFRGWLAHYPGVWSDFIRSRQTFLDRMEDDSMLAGDVARALDGRTGIECFDSWVEELRTTGYLHNHARMWFASIWIFTLGLPWQLGADFFLRHLIDGDAASNTCSWRWTAGLHTPGKTYLARAENIEKYTLGRFAPYGKLASHAPVPAVEDLPRPATDFPEHDLSEDLNYILLVTEDDLLPERLGLTSPPAAILFLNGPVARSPLPVSENVKDFTQGLIRDAIRRSRVSFGLDPVLAEPGDLRQSLLALASGLKIGRIVTALPGEGPVRDLILSEWPDGLQLAGVRRRFDSVLHPHASAGFFRIRKRMESIIASIGPGAGGARGDVVTPS